MPVGSEGVNASTGTEAARNSSRKPAVIQWRGRMPTAFGSADRASTMCAGLTASRANEVTPRPSITACSNIICGSSAEA